MSFIPQTRRPSHTVAAVAAFVLGFSILTPVGAAYAVDDGEIHGTVTSSNGGATLSGVFVDLYSNDGFDVDLVSTQLTSGIGEYSFTDLPYTNYTVEFRGGNAAPPHANQFYDKTYSLSTTVFFPVSDSTPVPVNVAMDPGATISGTVTGESGAPANGLVLLVHWVTGVQTQFYPTVVIPSNGIWEAPNLPAGDWTVRYSDLLPSATNYRTQYHDQVLTQTYQEFIPLAAGATVDLSARMSQAGPIPTERISGPDRYATSVEVSSKFDPFGGAAGTYVYVANGANYPDALSAAPAAAKRGAPLLLSPSNSLPANVAEEIERLDPENIIVAGGTGALSSAVFAALQALIDDPDKVVRLGGSDRYSTSQLIVADAFDNALTGFVATGRNYSDALAASAAAAHEFGPVILVDGAASSASAQAMTLIEDIGIETIYIAGGTGVVAEGIATDLATVPGVSTVTRLGGADRYATSLLINQAIFSTVFDGYLATGDGFADALAGAALAGKNLAPLYTVPSGCIPGAVLAEFRATEVDELFLLGGTGALSAAVKNLTRC